MAKDISEKTEVTVRDIANKCGVTIGTVSKALNYRNKLVNPQTAEYIRKIADEMGYDQNAFHEARRLSARRTGHKILNHLIGILMPAFFHKSTYYTDIYYGFFDDLTRERFGLLTVSVPDTRIDNSGIVFPPSMSRGEVDGVIFFGQKLERDTALLSELYQTAGHNFPVVTLMNHAVDLPAVVADDEMGGYQAISHLCGLGHRHFLYVKTGMTPQSVLQRIAGMHRALQERGLEHERHLHLLAGEVNLLHYYPPYIDDAVATLPENSSTLRYIMQYLREHPEITAIIAQNDLVAQEIWYSFRYLGINIPEDYSLIGYDDTEAIVNEYGANLLTTVHVPLSEIGRRAAQMVISLVKGELPPDTCIKLPTSLIVRNSTAPPRK